MLTMILLLVMIARAASLQVEDIARCTIDMSHVLLVVVILHALHRLKHLVVEAAMKEVLVTI